MESAQYTFAKSLEIENYDNYEKYDIRTRFVFHETYPRELNLWLRIKVRERNPLLLSCRNATQKSSQKEQLLFLLFLLSSDINMTNLPIHRSQFNHAIAVCLHGDKLLTRLWGSVKVEINFDETDVHTYEADR